MPQNAFLFCSTVEDRLTYAAINASSSQLVVTVNEKTAIRFNFSYKCSTGAGNNNMNNSANTPVNPIQQPVVKSTFSLLQLWGYIHEYPLYTTSYYTLYTTQLQRKILYFTKLTL